jgi:hypothetical protein
MDIEVTKEEFVATIAAQRGYLSLILNREIGRRWTDEARTATIKHLTQDIEDNEAKLKKSLVAYFL